MAKNNLLDLNNKSEDVYTKTFCYYGLEKALDEFQNEDVTLNITDQLRQQFNEEFKKAMIETFQHTETKVLNIKGKGTYRSMYGNYWEFNLENPELKSELTDIHPSQLKISSSQNPSYKPPSKKKK